jgi:hypothetical protein
VVAPRTRRERGGGSREEEIQWWRLTIQRWQLVGEDGGDLGEDRSGDGGYLARRQRGGADGVGEEEVGGWGWGGGRKLGGT